jgi:hypothetical protein
MTFWKVLTAALMFISGLSFLGRIYLRIHYAQTLSAQPQPNIGRIVPHNYKGLVVYLTQQEASLLNYLWWVSLISFLVVCCVAIYRKDLLIYNLRDNKYRRWF